MSSHIPTAEETPAFCERMSKEEAERRSKIETTRALTELGIKLQRDIDDKKTTKRNQGLDILNEHVKLSEMLNEYFDLDETSKKARMLDLLSELNKLRTRVDELSSMLDRVNRNYQEEKDLREDTDEQITIYDEEMKEIKEELNKHLKDKNRLINKIKEIEIESRKELREERMRKWTYKLGFYVISAYTIYLSYF